MRIAIDYDETFTADPVLWVKFIEHCRELDHSVVFVTARRGEEDDIEEIDAMLSHYGITGRPVFYTRLGSKIKFMESLGIRVDIWIDDNPHALVNGH